MSLAEADHEGVVTDLPSAPHPPILAKSLRSQASTLEAQCAECYAVSDMEVIGDDGGHLELKCPICESSTWVRFT